ncbi:hypothetical protein CF392_16330 [Tamilnaduibacter salinus]|uniref:Uncharacterized protein n=1 Tax=Tamilnaduibacter salinus TaxID=1484056 RepID=A0A2A2HYV4_9GAMM|nr:hypothetical protein [Tamilnaduibacter salinus]PAV24429.1 hypothetical protein CF392_16330 [Tamilnaduibacter salinus]
MSRSFRDFTQIPTPSALPDGAERIESLHRLDRELVLEGVNAILSAWNQGQLDTILVQDFADAQKLSDTVLTEVPRDARLALLSMRSYNVISQHRVAEPGDGDRRVSRVAVTVRLQLTFNDPRTGYQGLPSTSEFILEIREPI